MFSELVNVLYIVLKLERHCCMPSWFGFTCYFSIASCTHPHPCAQTHTHTHTHTHAHTHTEAQARATTHAHALVSQNSVLFHLFFLLKTFTKTYIHAYTLHTCIIFIHIHTNQKGIPTIQIIHLTTGMRTKMALQQSYTS